MTVTKLALNLCVQYKASDGLSAEGLHIQLIAGLLELIGCIWPAEHPSLQYVGA